MKSIIKIIITFFIFYFSFLITNAQSVLTIDGNQMVHSSGYIVLENTKLVNNSTFNAGTGEVMLKGHATSSETTIGGTTNTTFNNLQINKSANDVQLDNAISVSNQLTLTSGHLDLQTSDLTIESGGTISGGSSSSFIKTSSTGELIQEVGASNVVFPVGYTNYVPLTINNSGTTDNFQVRVVDAVYQDGTSGTELTTNVLDCTWYIDESVAGGSDVSLTFQWNTGDELSNFDRNVASVAHYTSGSWTDYTAQTASGSNPYTLTQSGITSFSPFTVTSDATALPVELLYFYAEKEGENVRLDWQTATEINNSHFDVEWSKDGINFEKIGEVAGAGTTNEVQFYDFLHQTPVTGKNYYRLKQHDFDGSYTYSDIINITIELPIAIGNNNLTINIYPNPATSYLVIETDYEGFVQLFSATGQFLFERNIQGRDNWDISSLPKGTYFLKIGETAKRIVVQ